MTLSDTIEANFEPHRRRSETVVAAFSAMTHNQIWVTLPAVFAAAGAFLFDRYANSFIWVVVPLLSLLPVAWFLVVNRNYTVIATNERTVVASASTFSVLTVEEIVNEHPATVQLGSPSGLIYTSSALGEPLKIHRRSFDQVRRADARAADL